VWRSLVAALGAIVATTGVAAAAPVRDTSARLTIEASTGPVSSVLVPSEASLDCAGGARGTGFLRKAASPACALVLRGAVTKVATAQRGARLCSDQYGGPQVARIRGTVGTRRVAVTITRADGCGIEEWNRLAALLGDPERRGAMPRPTHTSATTTTAPAVTYHVQRGDTLTAIAKQFHTSVAAIVTANALADADELTEGQPLVMPPPSAVHIDADLVDGQAASGFDLTLVGAAPSELVTFAITLPDGSTYTGSPHTASGYGVVTTTYDAAIGSGTYTVTATGGGGTNAQTSFHVVEPG
jgi:LysM repeat protein